MTELSQSTRLRIKIRRINLFSFFSPHYGHKLCTSRFRNGQPPRSLRVLPLRMTQGLSAASLRMARSSGTLLRPEAAYFGFATSWRRWNSYWGGGGEVVQRECYTNAQSAYLGASSEHASARQMCAAASKLAFQMPQICLLEADRAGTKQAALVCLPRRRSTSLCGNRAQKNSLDQ